ncbi:GNAT family N-acetyltransferase [Streptomyces cinereospinus]
MGVLTSWNDGVLVITRRDGERVRIEESALVAGKVVPAAPARRRGPAASYEELARISARAWRPLESERLGGWELRAAAGFTRRANSVLPLGDPGMPLDEALTAVRRWYGDRGLPAYLQTATGAEGTQELLCAELERRGGGRGRCPPSCGPGPSRRSPTGPRAPGWCCPGRRTRGGWRGTGARAWARWRRGCWAAVPRCGSRPCPARVAFPRPSAGAWWTGGGPGSPPWRWTPPCAGGGLASEVMAALARRALDEGASAAWLQVETDNAGARALYAGLGFGAHHTYHHVREPEGR